MKQRETRGFTLPTVMIVSVVMFGVLALAIQSSSLATSSLQEINYNQLAREAAESGIIHAYACLQENGYQPNWATSKPLKPNTDCDGNDTFSCPEGSSTTSCYVLSGFRDIRTTYRVYADYDTSTQRVVLRAESGASRVTSGTQTEIVNRSYFQRSVVDIGVTSAEAVDSGASQVCAIFDGRTWCWGSQLNGRLGNGVSSGDILITPIQVSRLEGALLGKRDKLVSVGDGNMCIATTDDEIYCTGHNSAGTVGDGTTVHRSVPTRVAKPAGMTGSVTQITAFRKSFCALTGGDVWCWGSGTFGVLGNGSTAHQPIPVKASVIGATATPSTPVTDIASDAESYHVCAIASVSGAGRAYCWGINGRGELGDNTTTNRSVPTPVYATGVLSGKNLKKIDLSGRYPDIRIDNDEYPTDAKLTTIAQTVADPARRNYARTGHTCVLDTAGKVYCWGSNQYGQLGTGPSHATYSSANPPWRQPIPVAVTTASLGTKVVTDLAVARVATCGLVGSEDKIYCWGRNDRGILGRGFMTTGNYPDAATVVEQTPGLAGQAIESITGGVNRFCALTDLRNFYCWGVGGSAGQIGDGYLLDRDVPTNASMLRKVRAPLLY